MEGFEDFIAAHMDAAHNFARWLTRDAHDAEDVVQESFVRAFKYFASRRGNERAWLMAIVRNTCYSWLSRNRQPGQHLYESLESEEAIAVADENNPQIEAMRESDRQLIGEALEKLKLEFREVLVLRELEDLSYREIAEIQGIPIGTVMSRLSRARGMLRQEIESLAGGKS